ncbi:hypothetical protein HT031_006485 [Scenedesmus sp. PABB004]|nr:hypothetical protein HT031_006485 [Scenedesmus sp. PABB004]
MQLAGPEHAPAGRRRPNHFSTAAPGRSPDHCACAAVRRARVAALWLLAALALAGGALGAEPTSKATKATTTAAAPAHRHHGSKDAKEGPPYPGGLCPYQCTNKPAPGGLPSCSSPVNTTCAAAPEEICPTRRYLDAFQAENYCMPYFKEDCSFPANIGCSTRCALWLVITYHCLTDAYSTMVGSNGTFNASCEFCNMCQLKSGAIGGRYALVRARGDTGGLFSRHYLVLPQVPCTGIESLKPECTGKSAEIIWNNVWREARALRFDYVGGTPTWAIMLNAPNRRGNHQMHIHIADLDTERTAPGGITKNEWLINRMAAATTFSTKLEQPTPFVGEGYYDPSQFNCSYGKNKGTPLGKPPKDWARSYAIWIPSSDPARDLGLSIRPFEIARRIAASVEGVYGYGITILPRRLGSSMGVVVAIHVSTDDWEQLSQAEIPGDPIGYSKTCTQVRGAAAGRAHAARRSTSLTLRRRPPRAR